METEVVKFSNKRLREPRTHAKRVTEGMKEIKPGQSLVIHDEKTARAFYAWLRKRGKAIFSKCSGGWDVGFVSANPVKKS